MKKTLISSVTAFAIVLSAGMAMAHPSGGHGHHEHAQDLNSAASQTRDHTDVKSDNNQTKKMSTDAATSEQSISLSSTPPSGSYQWSHDYNNY
ncbi:hypothetical protein [Ruegeria arenilitoris]|uniref:hypothetical protein n=1 Tax=Ruegeria arenilitoris TaxID=1173585 RepID=UPI00147F9E79|nr:hypothetical protein [Ruegeria arenilitoris]